MIERKLPISVKGIVVRKNDGASEALLLRNERREWELPGGRLEANETPETCLMREFKEETGLLVTVGAMVGSGVLTITPPHVVRATNVWIRVYGCHLQGIADSASQTITLSDEHQGWRWVSVAELEGMQDVPEVYKVFIHKLAHSLGY